MNCSYNKCSRSSGLEDVQRSLSEPRSTFISQPTSFGTLDMKKISIPVMEKDEDMKDSFTQEEKTLSDRSLNTLFDTRSNSKMGISVIDCMEDLAVAYKFEEGKGENQSLWIAQQEKFSPNRSTKINNTKSFCVLRDVKKVDSNYKTMIADMITRKYSDDISCGESEENSIKNNLFVSFEQALVTTERRKSKICRKQLTSYESEMPQLICHDDTIVMGETNMDGIRESIQLEHGHRVMTDAPSITTIDRDIENRNFLVHAIEKVYLRELLFQEALHKICDIVETKKLPKRLMIMRKFCRKKLEKCRKYYWQEAKGFEFDIQINLENTPTTDNEHLGDEEVDLSVVNPISLHDFNSVTKMEGTDILFLAYHPKHGLVSFKKFENKPEELLIYEKELKILNKCTNNDNLFPTILLNGRCDNDYYLIMKSYSQFSLKNVLENYKRLSYKVTKVYAAHIFLAIMYLHKRNISVVCLSPESIRFTNNNYPILTDFKYSLSNFHWNSRGTSNDLCHIDISDYTFIAPEVLFNFFFDNSCDYWSLGILIYLMYTGLNPFEKYLHMTQVNLLKSKICYEDIKLPKETNDDIKILNEFLKRLLRRLVRARLGYGINGSENVKRTQYFRDIDFNYFPYEDYSAPPIFFHSAN